MSRKQKRWFNVVAFAVFSITLDLTYPSPAENNLIPAGGRPIKTR